MTETYYRPRRQGKRLADVPKATWRRILRKCKRIDTGALSWVDDNGIQHDIDGPCWIFLGRTDSDGYGYAKCHRRACMAHRVAYAYRNGELPAGFDVDHICRQRACCNPAHLRKRTPLQNATDVSPAGESPPQVNKHTLSEGNYLPF